jgi:hypothetical protein
MIGERLLALAVRRERLRVRADGEREAIATRVRSLDVPFRMVDRVAGGVRWLKVNPAASVAILVAIVIVRPREVVALAQGGMRVWAAWRALRGPRARVAWALLPRVLDLYRGWRARR